MIRPACTLSSILLAVFCATSLWAQQPAKPPKEFSQVAAEAEAARNADRVEQAERLYRSGLTLNPKWAEGWWYLGTLLYGKNQFAEAADALRRSANLSPEIGTTWALLGISEANLHQDEDALADIEHGRKLGVNRDPQFRQVMLFQEGMVFLRRNEFEHAQENFDLISKENTEAAPELITALGSAVLRVNEKSPAVPQAAIVQAGTAEHSAALAKWDDALREYTKLRKDFSTVANVNYAFARFLVATREPDPEKVVEAYQAELKNNPGHVPSLLGVAAVRETTDPPAGLPFAEKAVGLDPKLPLGHYILGMLLLDTGAAPRAVTELETAEKAWPQEARLWFVLGRAYAKAGRPNDAAHARAMFKQLQEAASSGPAAMEAKDRK